MIKVSNIMVALLISGGASAETWTTETHNGVTYSRSNGQVLTTETHNGVTTTRSNDGKVWTTETHNGVTTTRSQH